LDRRYPTYQCVKVGRIAMNFHERKKVRTKYYEKYIKHGVPAPCKAQKGNCPYGGSDRHFNTEEEGAVFMTIRKIIVLCMSFAIVLGLCACSGEKEMKKD